MDHVFTPTLTAANFNGRNLYTISQVTRIYADPGTTVQLTHSVSDGFPCSATASGVISGHFVDVPQQQQ